MLGFTVWVVREVELGGLIWAIPCYGHDVQKGFCSFMPSLKTVFQYSFDSKSVYKMLGNHFEHHPGCKIIEGIEGICLDAPASARCLDALHFFTIL